MRFFNKIYPRKIISVMDHGHSSVAVLAAQKKSDDSFEILGAGDAPVRGVCNGRIVNMGDAVESAIEAIRKVEKASGMKIQTLYFNCDDAEMESIYTSGTKTLKGEGEIQVSDVEQAVEMAERRIGDFEKNIIYTKEIHFVIDDRDVVENPKGIFATKLEVEMHFLRAPSSHCDQWQKWIERCGLVRGIVVPSVWSTALGILSKNDRLKKRLILDIGNDFVNIIIFQNNGITALRVCQDFDKVSEATKELLSQSPGTEEILVVTELPGEEKILASLQKEISLPMRLASPTGVPKLNHPKYASLVGLLDVAEELEGKSNRSLNSKALFDSAKDKAMMYLNDYF